MVTINDLHDGLIFNCNPRSEFKESYLYEIKSLNKGIIYNRIYKYTYKGYSAKRILDYLNEGNWEIYKPINKIYELW